MTPIIPFQKRRIFYPLGFFIFISWIIYLADSADYNFAFRLIGWLPFGDKIGHGVLYGTMGLLANWGLHFRKYRGLHIGAILVLTFATIEEISQMFFPSRRFDLIDLLFDFIGVWLFTKIYLWAKGSEGKERFL